MSLNGDDTDIDRPSEKGGTHEGEEVVEPSLPPRGKSAHFYGLSTIFVLPSGK